MRWVQVLGHVRFVWAFCLILHLCEESNCPTRHHICPDTLSARYSFVNIALC